MKHILPVLMATLASAVFVGCANFGNAPIPAPPVKQFRGSANAAAVVVGLTRVNPKAYDGWNGKCPGCDEDAKTFAIACESNDVSYDLLLNEQATASGIEAYARDAVSRLTDGGLLILYMAGHGGEYDDPSDPTEKDGKSQTLCLWDGQLSDNLVWVLLSQVPAGIRVWMITDCCNSGSNFRSYNYTPMVQRRSRTTQRVPNLLHWGGCGDGENSQGSAQGGVFTTALVDAYATGQTYAEWFAAAKEKMPRNQTPTVAFTGKDFQDMPAFK